MNSNSEVTFLTTWTKQELEDYSRDYVALLVPAGQQKVNFSYAYNDIVSPRDARKDHRKDFSRYILSRTLMPLDEGLLWSCIMYHNDVPDEMLEALRQRDRRTELVVQIFHHEKYGADVPMTAEHYAEHLEHIELLNQYGIKTSVLW